MSSDRYQDILPRPHKSFTVPVRRLLNLNIDIVKVYPPYCVNMRLSTQIYFFGGDKT